ncbi:hypothetical protein EJB05_36185, partial [Eragrostis curvula]
MPRLVLLPILLLLGSSLFATTATNVDEPIHMDCVDNVTDAHAGAFDGILDALLSSLPAAAAASSGFAKDTIGSAPNLAYGLAQCRADVNASDCRACLDASAKDASAKCRGQRSAMVVREACMLRYSNASFFGAMDKSYEITKCGGDLHGQKNASTSTQQFRTHLSDLLINLTGKAAYRSPRLFAVGELEVSPSVKLYGMVQCTRDLAADDCHLCLASAVLSMLSPEYCDHMIFRSCFIRQEEYPFYNAKALEGADK